jgi:hypothetical protein
MKAAPLDGGMRGCLGPGRDGKRSSEIDDEEDESRQRVVDTVVHHPDL